MAQGSYSKWVIPIQARTSQVELRLRKDGNFSTLPASDVGKTMQLSGWEVHLRHSWTTTSTTMSATSTSVSTSHTAHQRGVTSLRLYKRHLDQHHQHRDLLPIGPFRAFGRGQQQRRHPQQWPSESQRGRVQELLLAIDDPLAPQVFNIEPEHACFEMTFLHKSGVTVAILECRGAWASSTPWKPIAPTRSARSCRARRPPSHQRPRTSTCE